MTAAWGLVLEYDGGPFVGWQRQRNGLSVQDVLEAAASRLGRGERIESIVAGRTDAGVHAEGQVARVSLPDPGAAAWTSDRLRDALNFHLKPHPVVVIRAFPAEAGWNPRFSATRRRYRYVILNRRARPTTARGRVWHVDRPLDETLMAAGARHLLGRHDFSAFRASACQARSPIRTLDVLDVARDEDLIVVRAEARSFLHHQVRNMVGSLVLVGAGRWATTRMAEVLASGDRKNAGPTAPPDGLTLVGVDYGPP